jgi:hypothetical protein
MSHRRVFQGVVRGSILTFFLSVVPGNTRDRRRPPHGFSLNTATEGLAFPSGHTEKAGT